MSGARRRLNWAVICPRLLGLPDGPPVRHTHGHTPAKLLEYIFILECSCLPCRGSRFTNANTYSIFAAIFPFHLVFKLELFVNYAASP